MEQIKCTRCGKVLENENPTMLELSNTDGHYYSPDIPIGHESQGAFPFGLKCATLEMIDTVKFLNNKIGLYNGIIN